jgi:hypothetical protein
MLRWPTHRREPRSAGRARLRKISALIAATSIVDLSLAFLACDGTTGRPDPVLPASDDASDATVGEGGDGSNPDAMEGGDAGNEVGLYTGLFDVAIQYADRDLPEIMAAPSLEAGADGNSGFPFPISCPPYITVDMSTRKPVDIASCPGLCDEVPADPTSDGGSTIAPDGSVCDYPWLGGAAIQECATVNWALQQPSAPALPPCNWCPPGSGVVNSGPNPGEDRTLACWTLYECMMRTGCYIGTGTNVNSAAGCLCGSEVTTACATDPHPSGPCATEELEALETLDPNQALQEFIQTATPGTSGATCGSYLNAVFTNTLGSGCIPAQGDP